MNVFIIAAMSADGFIAQDKHQVSTAWTSKEDKKFFTERTKQAGVMVMGSTTYNTIGRPLPGRLTIVYSRSGGEEASAKYDPSQLRFTQAKPAELIKQLAAEGFSEVAICGGSSVYTMFLNAGVVDSLYLTVEPVVFGSGVKLFGEGAGAQLSPIDVKKLSEQTILLEYQVKKRLKFQKETNF